MWDRALHFHPRPLLATAALVCALWAIPLHAGTLDFGAFVDRQHYTSVLLQQGRVQLDADFNEEQETAIKQGQIFKIFSFSFDPSAVQPVVGAGIVSGLAVGAEPNGTLGGDQGFSLHVTPGLGLMAFGGVISFGPFDGAHPLNIFRLVVGCPDIPCFSVGNPAGLSPQGGSVFLGVIGDPGVVFNQVTLEALTPSDDSGEATGIVPTWQLGSITFTPVPLPFTLVLITIDLGSLAALRGRGGTWSR